MLCTNADSPLMSAMEILRQPPEPVPCCRFYFRRVSAVILMPSQLAAALVECRVAFVWPAAKVNAGRDGFDDSVKTQPLYPCALAIMTRSQFGGTVRSKAPESFIR